MAINTVGDLAMSYIFRSRNAQTKADLARLSQEVATGQVASVSDAVKGDFGTLSAIENNLGQLEAYRGSINEAAGFTGAVQGTLESIRQTAEGISHDLLASSSMGQSALSSSLAGSATDAFETAVSRLNTSFGGRSLFAGIATKSAAVAPAETILAALETAVSSETTAAGVKSVVDEWFAAGGGFDSVAYLGSTTPLAPMAAGQGKQVSIAVTAADAPLRDTLRGLALAALINRAPLQSSSSQQAKMAVMASETLMQANTEMLDEQAKVGIAQESFETALASNASETAAMKLAMSNILSADPYDRATQLKQAETQLEMLYTLTARTAAMKLSDYL
ncbi:flagellin [Tropicimonas isoalkanivorans]|uniref:Flagellar hook-associated protein 3 FlgL n=1 Tax=Tropicimonas isoalkanivorans TaxID=441112 RepID=A0A1I1L4R2_9RHOB|nr:flagellin [Tropicimonas isoalkanivorans]SFC65988.1 flagellar hook-associated protein 3 FlgL [Tropicimonas isoalkanivorans]